MQQDVVICEEPARVQSPRAEDDLESRHSDSDQHHRVSPRSVWPVDGNFTARLSHAGSRLGGGRQRSRLLTPLGERESRLSVPVESEAREQHMAERFEFDVCVVGGRRSRRLSARRGLRVPGPARLHLRHQRCQLSIASTRVSRPSWRPGVAGATGEGAGLRDLGRQHAIGPRQSLRARDRGGRAPRSTSTSARTPRRCPRVIGALAEHAATRSAHRAAQHRLPRCDPSRREADRPRGLRSSTWRSARSGSPRATR